MLVYSSVRWRQSDEPNPFSTGNKTKQIKEFSKYTYYLAHANIIEKTITALALGDNTGLIGGLIFAGQIKKALINRSKPQ